MFLSYTTTINAAIQAGIVNEYINASKTRDNDIYNEQGINISAQQRRQRLFVWKTVDYSKKKNKTNYYENEDDMMEDFDENEDQDDNDNENDNQNQSYS